MVVTGGVVSSLLDRPIVGVTAKPMNRAMILKTIPILIDSLLVTIPPIVGIFLTI